ncbi:MAG TPA: hypothetical protein VM389_14570 [Phycisphaerae bacterium]|nr:hypothetical protein [Phycisphaerae bacterium]
MKTVPNSSPPARMCQPTTSETFHPARPKLSGTSQTRAPSSTANEPRVATSVRQFATPQTTRNTPPRRISSEEVSPAEPEQLPTNRLHMSANWPCLAADRGVAAETVSML